MEHNKNCCCRHHSESRTKTAGKWVFSVGFVFVLVILTKPFMADQLIRRADAYYCNGLYEDAVRQYEKAILLDESESFVWVSLGNSLQAKNEIGKAIAAYKKSVELAPEDRAANYNLGAAFAISKDYRSAVMYLEKVRTLGPESKEELLGGGFSYYRASLDALAMCFEKLEEFGKSAVIRKELSQLRRGER